MALVRFCMCDLSAAGNRPCEMLSICNKAVHLLARLSTAASTPSALEWHAESEALNDSLMYTG
jgi:hypothetical protein